MRGQIYIVLLGTFLVVGIISNSAVAGQPNFCTQTSHDTLKSCNYGVRDNYWLAIGKCDNLPTQSERKACRQEALQDEKSGFEECRAQFAARQEICRTLGKDPYNPIIDPANFVTGSSNQYFPLTPGSVWIYDGITEKATNTLWLPSQAIKKSSSG